MARPKLGLRGQLALLSVLVLVLPLAVLQYVRLVQQDLLQAQLQALSAELSAAAMRLASSESHLDRYFPAPDAAGLRLYPLASRPPLDGSCDDWSLAGGNTSAELLAGYFQGDLFLCLRRQVPQGEPEIVRLEGDSIRLQYSGAAGGSLYGQELADGGERMRYETRASWIDWVNGYQMEIQVPRFLLGDRLGIEVFAGGVETRALFGYSQGEVQRYYLQPGADESGLQAVEGEQLLLLAPNGQLLASHNRLSGEEPESLSRWRALLANLLPPAVNGQAPPVPDSSGKVENLPSAATGLRYAYYGSPARPVLALLHPVDLEGLRIGWLLSMRPAISVSAGNLAALDRLILNTAAVCMLIALAFLAYAGWLVRRVRRLERQTAGLLVRGEQPGLPATGPGDELSQLSEQFRRMVERLNGYTSYLQGLAGKLSHEIRTPLAIVSSSLDNFEASRDEQEKARCLARARGGLDRLDRILSLMAQASSFEQLLDEMELEEYAPVPVLTELVQAYKAGYSAAEVSLQCNGCELTDLAWGSPDLLVQALDKLVDNAVDFATGEIRICLNLDENNWNLLVENEGPVLPPQMQHNLFDALVSVRPKGQQQVHLGFGLQMVQRIAAKWGGAVTASNLPDGSGVCFCLQIPCSEPGSG